jgi:hypothetical protein
MDKVRAKFKCISRTETEGGWEVQLKPVTASNTPHTENDTFFKWTPYGELKMGLLSNETAMMFVVGTEFYLDFIPVTNP